LFLTTFAACASKQPDVQPSGAVAAPIALATPPEAQTSAGAAISATEAQALLARVEKATAEAAPKADLPSLLARIPQTDGVDRQKLLQEYVAAAHQLPNAERDQAMKNLIGVFKK
jgi:hypothetical protein